LKQIKTNNRTQANQQNNNFIKSPTRLLDLKQDKDGVTKTQSCQGGFLEGLGIFFAIGVETMKAKFRGGGWDGGRLARESCNSEG